MTFCLGAFSGAISISSYIPLNMLSDDKGLVEFGGETNGKGLVNEIIHFCS
jgi:hypothetical protein